MIIGKKIKSLVFLFTFMSVLASVVLAQDVVISPSPLFLGKIPLGSSSDREITIFNTTVNQVTVSSVSLSGADASSFTIIDNPGSFTLAPIGKQSITIRYEASGAEKNTAIFQIQSSAGTFSDSLIGYGIPTTGGVQPFERILGTTEEDGGHNIRQTSDGGFIITGSTLPPGDDYRSVYLLKTDVNGKVEWTSTYGNSRGIDTGSDVEQTSDGYLVLGTTENWGEGGNDMMLVKFNSTGEFQWRKTYGGPDEDNGTAMLKTSDGGYALVGQTVPSGGVGKNIFLVKVSADGTEQWRNNYGGGNGADGSGIVQLDDGNFILAGYTTIGDDFQVYLIKVSSSGSLIWEKNYGGSDYDIGSSINKTQDGNLLVCGYTASKGAGARDGYILKIDLDGNLIWDKTYGTERSDQFGGVVETTDGNIIAVGISITRVTQDEQFNSAFIVKTNSDGTQIWSQIYGGELEDNFGEVRITNDGGAICVGTTESFSKSGDIYLVKVGSSGVVSGIVGDVVLPSSFQLE
ncbi:MAG TPA: hypothetical protein VLA13_03175, partial [Massilibacterium sp.]|nr:hypothetical protein [Massilibacterium sp.]